MGRAVPVILSALVISFFILSASVKADTICFYKGPDVSGDMLRLTGFSVSGPPVLREGDTITVKFTLQNYGQSDLKLGSKGIFVAARGPGGGDESFGFTRMNTVLRVGETVSVEVSRTLDEAGSWLIWPSYHLSLASGERFGPDNWHGCSIVVLTAIRDSDKDGVADERDNCPLKHNPGQEDRDKDGIGDVCDNCPDTKNPDQRDENRNGIGDACEITPKRDTTPPTVTIDHHPALNVYTNTDVTFNVIVTDDTNVTRILIYVDGKVKECGPIEYLPGNGYWRCAWHAGKFPAGSFTYRAEAFDPAGNKGISAEKTLNVTGTAPPTLPPTLPPPMGTPPETAPGVRCSISGRIYDFKYRSRTLAVKACEAEVIEGGCSLTPPYTCLPPMIRCKEGGGVYYDTDLARLWAGEEAFGMPGPMEYHIDVPCGRSYLIEPIYQPYGDECPWRGSWRASKGNFVPSTEPLAEGYDFHFEPMDLNPPTIISAPSQIFPEGWNELLSDEQFEIRVTGFDREGVQSIKLWLNVTAIGFTSDEKGPLEGVVEPERTLILRFTKECNSRECSIRTEDLEPLVCRPGDSRGCYCTLGCLDDLVDEVFRIGMNNVAKIRLDLKVKVCDVAGNSVINSYERTYPDLGDLRIVSADPVQVVYGAPLVRGKGTAFRVGVESTFERDVEAKFRLMLPDDQWGIVSSTGNYRIGLPPEEWRGMHDQVFGPIRLHRGTNEIMIPIIPDWKKYDAGMGLGSVIRGRCLSGTCGPDVRMMPMPIADRVSFRVEVDPENEIRETDEMNNVFSSGGYDVKKTRSWRFLFIPVRNADGCMPNLNFVGNGSRRQLEYLLAMFPIADGKISYSVKPVTVFDPASNTGYAEEYDDGDRCNLLRRFAREAKSEGYDFAVAVGCGCGGGTCDSDAAVIGDCYGSYVHVLSHEFNHVVVPMGDIYSFRDVGWGDLYCEFGDHAEEYLPEDRYSEEYIAENKHKLACEVFCEESGRISDCPRWAETYYGTEAQRCNEWSSLTNRPARECPQYVKDWTPCQAWCVNYACPSERLLVERECHPGTYEMKSMAQYWCEQSGGQKVYSSPDARNVLPASEGFWVNRWIPISSRTSAYIMDSCLQSCDCTLNWMRLESVKSCVEKGECGHRMPDGSIVWGDLGAASGAVVDNDGYLNLLESDRFRSETDPEALLVSGLINKNGSATLDPFIRLSNASLDVRPGQNGDYYFVLLDKNGNILTKSGFRLSFRMSDPNGGPVDRASFAYRIEWKDGTRRIELRDEEGNLLASRDVSPHGPEVKVLRPNGGEIFERGGIIEVRWQASDRDGDALTYSLAISRDGETWIPIDADLKADAYRLNATGLEEGDYLIKVRATDGVNTAEDVSDSRFTIRGVGKIVQTSSKPAPGFELPIHLPVMAVIAASVIVFIIVRMRGKK